MLYHLINVNTVDGFEQKMETPKMKIVHMKDEVERVARWEQDGVQNSFEEIRNARARFLGLN